MNKLEKQIKNIFVLRNDRFGEFLLNIPALRALRETFKEAKITLCVQAAVAELAGLTHLADDIVVCNVAHLGFSEKIKWRKFFQDKQFDLAVMLNPSKDFNLIAFVGAVRIRVGYDRKWGFLLTHKLKDLKYLGLKHEVEYNLELVALLGAVTNNKSVGLAIKEEKYYDEKSPLAVHPWTSDALKQWPLKRFAELIRKLTGELKQEVVVVGGEENTALSTQTFPEDELLKDLTGKTSLVELAGLLKKCKLLISGDSGPVHLAGAVNTPVIAIFRKDIPAKSSRRWGPWQEKGWVIEQDTLAEITVDEVFKKTKEALKLCSTH